MRSKTSQRVLNIAFVLAIGIAFAHAQNPAIASNRIKNPPAIVTTGWLRHHLNEHNLVILEVYDHDRQVFSFYKGHIPGAQFTAFMDDGWLTLNTGYPFMLPSVTQLARLVGHYGISNSTRVILVPGGRKHGDFMATARIYWTFRYLGDHNVSILNGGDIAWNHDQRDKTSEDEKKHGEKRFIPDVITSILARTPAVKTALETRHIQLIDARPKLQFQAIVKAPVDAEAGTLFGAENLPYSLFLTPGDEGIVDAKAVASIIRHEGVILRSPSIVFCNTGHLASSDWFVLHEVMHVKNIRLYTGSMSTWTRDGLPVVPGKPRT